MFAIIFFFVACKANANISSSIKPSTNPQYENALAQYDLDKVSAIMLFDPSYEQGNSLIYDSKYLSNIITIYKETAKGILNNANFAEGLGIHQGSEQGKIIFEDGSYLDITVFQRGQWFDINGITGHYDIADDYVVDYTDLSTVFSTALDTTKLKECNELILPEKTSDSLIFSFKDGTSLTIPYNNAIGLISAKDFFEVVEFQYHREIKVIAYKIGENGSLSLLYEDGLYDGTFIRWDAELNTITELVALTQ